MTDLALPAPPVRSASSVSWEAHAGSWRSRLMVGAQFVSFVYLFVVGFLLLSLLVPVVVGGWQPLAVVSGSMQPAIQPGSVVMIEPAEADQFYATPTIVAFDDPAHPASLVTHRVEDTVSDGNGSAVYTTKGDANRVADSSPVAHDDVVGAVRMVVPFVGLPAWWLASGQPLLLVAFALATLAAIAAVTVWARP